MGPFSTDGCEGERSSFSQIATTCPDDTLRARDVMQCGVVTVDAQDSVYKAIGILTDKRISGLPVVRDGWLVGILSEKDVLRSLYERESLTGTVEQYMTPNVVSFDIESPLADIGQTLVSTGFRRVAILHEGRLAGIITRADLIRHTKYRLLSLAESTDSSSYGPLVKDFMQCGLLTVKRQTALYEAADILAARHITGLPVVDDSMNLDGIITEKDILRMLFDQAVTGRIVEDLMTQDVVSFMPSDGLLSVCRCLIQNDFHRVPVLDGRRLVGIISSADIIMYILKNKSTAYKHLHAGVSAAMRK
jgi:CBS domain-containing protein